MGRSRIMWTRPGHCGESRVGRGSKVRARAGAEPVAVQDNLGFGYGSGRVAGEQSRSKAVHAPAVAFTNILPVLRLWNRPTKPSGARSNPSKIVSWYLMRAGLQPSRHFSFETRSEMSKIR
jgi:hypothetical protein